MARTDKAKFAAFTRLVASGLFIRTAGTAVGYALKSNACYEMAGKPVFKAEVERLKAELKHGGTNDLAPVIAALMDGAETAMKGEKPTPAHMNAAARLLAEAGAAETEAAQDGARPAARRG